MFKTKHKEVITYTTRDRLDMKAEEWRMNSELLASAKNLQSSPVFKAMMDVLDAEAPSNYELTISNDLNNRVVHQCRVEGYNRCKNILLSLATPIKIKRDELQVTFEPVNYNKE